MDSRTVRQQRDDDRMDSRTVRQRKELKHQEDDDGISREYRRNDREDQYHRRQYERGEKESVEIRSDSKTVTEQKTGENLSNGHVEFIHGHKFEKAKFDSSSHNNSNRDYRSKPHQHGSRRGSGYELRGPRSEFRRKQREYEDFR